MINLNYHLERIEKEPGNYKTVLGVSVMLFLETI